MLVDYDSDAPAVVGGEMAPAPQDNGGEEMGAVYEPVHGETATSVGTVVQIPFLLPSVLLIYSASSITTGIQVATTVVSFKFSDSQYSLLRKLGCVIKCR